VLYDNVRDLDLSECEVSDNSLAVIASRCHILKKVDLNAAKSSRTAVTSQGWYDKYLTAVCLKHGRFIFQWFYLISSVYQGVLHLLTDSLHFKSTSVQNIIYIKLRYIIMHFSKRSMKNISEHCNCITEKSWVYPSLIGWCHVLDFSVYLKTDVGFTFQTMGYRFGFQFGWFTKIYYQFYFNLIISVSLYFRHEICLPY